LCIAGKTACWFDNHEDFLMTVSNTQALGNDIQLHIRQFTEWFNEAASERKLGITLDASAVLKRIEHSLPDELRELWGRMAEDKVHKEQVQTAVEAIALTIEEPGRSGIVLGALQSGKTGSAFMSLFAAPVHYLKTRVTYVPLFVTTNQTSHMVQTQKAMRSFFELYGRISIVSDGNSRSLIDYYSESGNDLAETPAEENEITLHGYHTRISDEMYPGTNIVDSVVKGITVKRVPGGIAKKVASYCQRARERGHAVMLIVDEPQYGASNTRKKDGTEVECLLSRLFKEVDPDFFSPDSPHFMIGLSATPFDSAGISNLWHVRQRLNASYVGPNFFGGRKIDPDVSTASPAIASFKDIAAKGNGLEWFNEISYLIGATKKPLRDGFRATRIDADGVKQEMGILERRKKGADMLRILLDGTLADRQKSEPQPIGALLRIANNKKSTEEVLDAMGIEGADSPYNVIKFYSASGDIKDIIWKATRNDPRPYLVVTVGKGRMGDAFPPSTCIAADLSNAATDANSFLQGVFGRMCGYGKKDPLVIVSAKSQELYLQYQENTGNVTDFGHSKHVLTRTIKRGRNHDETYFMITDEMIEAEPAGSPLRAFRADIIAYLEQQNLSKPTMKADVPHRANQFMPLPQIMEKHGIVEYIEQNSGRLDPELKNAPRIVKPGESGTYEKRDRTTVVIGYETNADDWCKVLVSKVGYNSSDTTYEAGLTHSRRSSQGLASGGRRDPAKHVNRGRRNDRIMPVITVKKVDEDGHPVALNEMGKYIFDGIVMHLASPVRRYSPSVNRTSLADGHAMAGALTDDEKVNRLADHISRHMNSKRQYSFMEALGMGDVHAMLADLHDGRTHTYYVEGQALVFLSKESGGISNSCGPSVINLHDLERVVTSYITQDEQIEEVGIDLNEEPHEYEPTAAFGR
jgi:hypothetical protein